MKKNVRVSGVMGDHWSSSVLAHSWPQGRPTCMALRARSTTPLVFLLQDAGLCIESLTLLSSKG